jgi:hypothetical protein
MQFLNTLKIILDLIPMIINVIKAIEEAIPGHGAGEQKLAMVRGVIEAGYKAGKDAVMSFEQIWPILETTIKTIVAGLNATGVFKK